MSFLAPPPRILQSPKVAATGAAAPSPASSNVVVTSEVYGKFYVVNVLLNTILFILTFMAGTSWTSATIEFVKHEKSATKMLVFSAILTLVTLGLAIGFGELSRVNSEINVNYQRDLP